MPFGGGIDSIVTVEHVRRRADAALFIMSRPGSRFEAIEAPAAVTGLPIVRAGREIDPQLLRSAELGFLNGHVPVTGILSAIAVMAAVLAGRDAVVMSNEWSASIPTLEADGRPVNHQFSKSMTFEGAFREVLATALGGGSGGRSAVSYFSFLRPFSELWVAQRFAGLTEYHGTFRSCNRAFHLDESKRLDHWCGRCDKCCFIDLILAPFLPAAELSAIFGGQEPLADGDPGEDPLEPPQEPARPSPWPRSSARCWARCPTASRSSASARSASAGPPRCSPRSGRTAPAPGCSRCWRPRWPRPPTCPTPPSCCCP